MNKVIFSKHGLTKPIESAYILLSYFIDDAGRYKIDEIISDLESVASGEKKFGEIQDPDVSWTYGNSSGEFICNKDTAYFKSDGYSDYPNMQIPLSELISLLKEWKAFLNK